MTHRHVVLVVVFGLVAMAFGGLLLSGILAMRQLPIPDLVQNVTIGAMTALAGILSKTSTSDDVQQVEVTNQPENPAQVEIAETG